MITDIETIDKKVQRTILTFILFVQTGYLIHIIPVLVNPRIANYIRLIFTFFSFVNLHAIWTVESDSVVYNHLMYVYPMLPLTLILLSFLM